MASILTKNQSIFNAKQVRESLNESEGTSMYAFIGRTTDWNHATADILVDSIETQYNVWSDMISAKRIRYSDVEFVVPRIDWASGFEFDQYDPRNFDFHNSNTYCYTSNSKVYMCLSNNDAIASTVEPNGEGTSPEITSDGYKWQYLYKVDALSGYKFLDITGSWMPVLQNSDLQTGQEKGRITQINVIDPGEYETYNFSGYDLTVSSDSGSNLEASVTLTYDGGIKEIAITTAGTYAETSCTHPLAAISSTGIGFAGTADVDSGGAVTSVTISNAGSNYYDSNTTIYVSGVEDPSVNAVFDPTTTKFVVDEVSITDQGKNYRDVSLFLDHPSITSNASFEGVINPFYGIGYDMVKDLHAKWLMYDVKMKDPSIDTDLLGGNSYRMLGLIVDPQDRANACVATKETYNMTTQFDLSNNAVTSEFAVNEFLTQSVTEATANVAWYDNVNTQLYVYNTSGTFELNQQISTDTASANGITAITQSGLVKDLGDIIYLEYFENADAITRKTNQGEDHKIIIQY